MKTFSKHFATLLAIGIVFSGFSMAASPMAEKLRALKGAEFEQSFLSQMIEHHRNAVEMAKLVPHHTERAELKQLASSITQMQQEEIKQMTSLLAGSSGMPMSNQDQMEKTQQDGMEKLEAAKGQQFDQAFIDQMIQHHSDGLEMAQLAKTRATRPEVLQIAEKIAGEQQDDIQKLKGLRS